MSVFVHAQGIKNVHAGGEGQNSFHVVVELPLAAQYKKFKNNLRIYDNSSNFLELFPLELLQINNLEIFILMI